MGDISPNFSLAEFSTCGRGECDRTYVDPVLLCCLEGLRKICGGRPLNIISGYRCPRCNKRVGGATASRHLTGQAADIPYGYATVAQAREAGFRGIGTRGRFATHVDVRPTDAQWSYD